MVKNKNLIGFVVVIIIIILVIFFSIYGNEINKEEYSVVYLSTGEVYVGKLSLPAWDLKDVYIFQAVKDPVKQGKNNFQLSAVKDALWAPEVIHLVKENVIFYGPLKKESRIVQTLTEQNK